jgi:2-dehydro-3-deoxyphosphogluconate aldolase / (4S)-4-hydroxy-2-oxoglutarate aldolase
MAKFSRLQVLQIMISTGLVPVFYHKDIETATLIVNALLDGGARCVEFTNRGDQAHLVFGELVRRFQEDDRAIFGVGSIIDASTAGLFIQLGANFIVGPILNSEIAKTCNLRKVAYSPGCGSVNEISQAEALGVEIVKIFPGSQVGGPGFVKSVRGPMPWTSIMPTGGVEPTQENMKAWFDAGVVCVGMGSKLIRKDWVENREFEKIKSTTAQTINWIKQIK